MSATLFNPDLLILLKHLGPPQRENNRSCHVLDIGHGKTGMALELARYGYDVVALNSETPSLDMLAKTGLHEVSDVYARFTETSGLHIIGTTVESYEASGLFDGICCFNFLHSRKSWSDVAIVLDKITALSSAQGVFLLSWITHDSLRARDVYFPQQNDVFSYLIYKKWNGITAWTKEITHKHDGLPLHQHTVSYAAWRKQ